MKKVILITGATDGIGLETARRLAAEGHFFLIHGRSDQKLAGAAAELTALGVGADILQRAALATEFTDASGRYFDNDKGHFAPPHADALDPQKNQRLVEAMESVIGRLRA